MTLRNAIAKFGMPSAVVLGLLAVVACAALLFISPPTSAQGAQDGEEIWSATLTVGSTSNARGYSSLNVGSLSDTSFRLGSDNVAVLILVESPSPGNELHIALDTELDTGQLDAMKLSVDGRAFNFSFATYNLDAAFNHVYTWTHFQNFGWTNGQTIAVSITALPIITLEAVTAQVEHKGIAEFRFTRTGSTDEDLTFNLEFSETGETTTTKFRSGKSTLTLYHWAVDTDSSDEPLCTITWLVIAGEGYVRGDPFDAVVDIEGPGTTCM